MMIDPSEERRKAAAAAEEACPADLSKSIQRCRRSPSLSSLRRSEASVVALASVKTAILPQAPTIVADFEKIFLYKMHTR